MLVVLVGFFCVCVSIYLSLWCSGQKTFTVEEAVEIIGFGRFHILLFLIMGSTGVGVCSHLQWPEKTLFLFSLLLFNNYKHHGHTLQPFFSHIPSQAQCLQLSSLAKINGPQMIADLLQGKAEQVSPEHPGVPPALEHHPTRQP